MIGDMIRIAVASIIKRLAEPIPPTQPARITYLYMSDEREDSRRQ